MGGRAAGFRPAVGGGVGRLSPGSDWETDCPDIGRTALRSPMQCASFACAVLVITRVFRMASAPMRAPLAITWR